VYREVVVDGTLITSRKPDDLPAFCTKMIEVFRQRPSATARQARRA
jgi:protease I